MDTNKNVYINNEITNKIHTYPTATAVLISNNDDENINYNDRNIYNSYRSSQNSLSSIDLHTPIPTPIPSPSIDLTKTYPDGLKTPPRSVKTRGEKHKRLLSHNNTLIFTCRDCLNIYTPDPYDQGSMGYYRCEICRETFVQRSCCASCTIS